MQNQEKSKGHDIWQNNEIVKKLVLNKRKSYTVKSKVQIIILEYLEKNKYALLSQIINEFGIIDSRNITSCLKQLIEKKRIKKIVYGSLKFYTLFGNEADLITKIQEVKKSIIDIIKEWGPIKSRALAYKLIDFYKIEVNHRMVFILAKELVKEKELSALRIHLSNLYYEISNPKQEKKASNIQKEFEDKKRLKIIESILDDYVDRIFFENEIDSVLKQKIKEELHRDLPILCDIDCKGRSYKELIIVYSWLGIKKFLSSTAGNTFKIEDMKDLLDLHNILLNEKNRIPTQTRHYFFRQVLNSPDFCKNHNKKQIFNSPNINLKMQYYLSLLNLKKEINHKIRIYIKKAISSGYNIDGKDVKGIIGGVFYLISSLNKLGITQKEISNKLNITEVTLRNRYQEIKKFSYNGALSTDLVRLDATDTQNSLNNGKLLKSEELQGRQNEAMHLTNNNFEVSSEIDLEKNNIYRNINDFDLLWQEFNRLLPPGRIIFTLKLHEPNEIMKIGDIGITVKTGKSATIITKDLIKRAWINFANDGVLYQKDHAKSTYRSSFILALFSQLNFVEVAPYGPLSIKLK